MLSEQMQLSICSCLDLLPPDVVTLVAEPVREPDVVGGEVTSVHLESRIVVGRGPPLGITHRSRLEVPTTPEAVALGHLATHVDELAIARKLPEDSTNSKGLELLIWSFSRLNQTRASYESTRSAPCFSRAARIACSGSIAPAPSSSNTCA
jgi:hypothetical protein